MTKKTGLELLREPFPPHQISKLPKPTRQQTEEVKQNFKIGIRCTECGQWHHPKVVHLDYVGHAALTDRLLDCDPEWNWQPMAVQENGAPVLDGNGGMWINLTVCGVTRIGYGDAEGKQGGNAVKEVIGDALRNAAMRFGAALDLWHKGDLHGNDDTPEPVAEDQPETQEVKKASKGPKNVSEDEAEILEDLARLAKSDRAEIFKALGVNGNSWADLPEEHFKRVRDGMQRKIDAEYDKAVKEQ